MSFCEAPSFPQVQAYGSSGGPAFATVVTTGISGVEARLGRWSAERSVWDLSYMLRTGTETASLLAFFRCIAFGRWQGFRFRPFGPGEATGEREPLGVGDGLTRVFQLRKRAAQDELTVDRVITKPVPGTVTVYANTVLVASTLWEVDTARGQVSFFLPPADGVVLTASFEFDVPVRCDMDQLRVRRIAPDGYQWEGLMLRELQDAEVLRDADTDGTSGVLDLVEGWEWDGTALLTATAVDVSSEDFN